MIKFGISENYVPKWGIVQAIREIYQNFIDHDDQFSVKKTEFTDSDLVKITITNTFKPENWEFLKIGFSKKKTGSIGQHGEGLKLAGLIFKRNDRVFRIKTPLGTAFPQYYEDDSLGTCYGLEIHDEKSEFFTISFTATKEEIKIFEEGVIQKEDILHSCCYGDIVNKKAGNIYIGGLYVCHLTDLKYALNFKPAFVEIGRDRDIPSTWSMEYYTNQIINDCSKELKFKAEDVYNREFSAGDFPKVLASKFKPVYSEEGNLQLQSGKTIITEKDTIRKLSKNPIITKRIQKLKYKTVFKNKKSPSFILQELTKEMSLNESDQIKMKEVIKLSKNWKVK